MTTLPCFVGDFDPLLVRVPGTTLHVHGTLWLLTQGETHKVKHAAFRGVHISQACRIRATSRDFPLLTTEGWQVA
jgi:hypothetical protein